MIEVFEILVQLVHVFVLEESLITMLPRDVVVVSTWWLSDSCLRNALLYAHFDIVGLQAARCPVVRVARYRRYSRYLRRLTVFFTATIYRDIPWPRRY